ncbi:MAG TPA: extracellular solute-binding protein [Pseudobacteroides sp.]|uniref:ABC transporter substrate-binding protein n=1 Tax=Pseudobacteroides sp. TaxID=1968840 RepID=UPI002F92D940
MKKSKKVLALLVCIFMTTGTLTACLSDNPGEGGSESGENATPVVSNSGDNKEVNKSPEDYKGEIVFWHFNSSEGPKISQAFNKLYPNVKVKTTIVSDRDSQYQNKLTAALRAGVGVPDVFVAESAFAKRLVEMPGAFLDLTERAKDVASKMIPFTVQVGTDKNGALKALSHQAAPGAIAYKKTVAKKYLGTDDPKAIAEMLSSEEKMLETAKILKEKSGGKVALFPTWEEPKKMYLGARSKGWVVDDKLNIDQKVMELIDFSKNLRDNKYESGLTQWTPGWSSAIAANETSMVWALPPWGVPWIINSNDKTAANGGKWGITNPPFKYFWGGTWMGIYANSQNQDIAWEFVKFFTANKDTVKKWALDNQDFPNNLEIIAEGSPSDSNIVGANLFKFYEPFVKDINGEVLTQYDDIIERTFDDVMVSYLAGKYKTKDDMVKAFKDKVKTNLKEIQVD